MRWPSAVEYLKSKALRYGDSPLLKDYGTDTSYSYTDFDAASDRVAGGFIRAGAVPRDRIAFLHHNHTDVLIGYFASIKAGAIAVPINPAYTTREILHILNDSGAKLLVSQERFSKSLETIRKEASPVTEVITKETGQSLEEALRATVGSLSPVEPAQSSGDEVAMIFYTSGTTGLPKGVMISHRNITFGAGNMAQNYGLNALDTTIVCLPLNHIFANASPFWGTLASGGTAIVMERFQTEPVFDAIRRERVTWFPGVPTMFTFLLSSFEDHSRDVTSLRMGLSGGDSLSIERLREFEANFGAFMLEVYGLTESTGLVTANPVYGVRKPGSIGICVSGVAVRLVNPDWRDVPKGEVGELIFKGPNGALGYWGLPEETERKIRGGWISTGDLAYQDDDGYFYISGRKSELMISGGYNIYPREIEDVIRRHPDVLEAAVIGVNDSALGQVPKAFVVPARGKALEVIDLERFCCENLSKYKVPKLFIIMDELPKNSTGKILRKELK